MRRGSRHQNTNHLERHRNRHIQHSTSAYQSYKKQLSYTHCKKSNKKRNFVLTSQTAITNKYI